MRRTWMMILHLPTWGMKKKMIKIIYLWRFVIGNWSELVFNAQGFIGLLLLV